MGNGEKSGSISLVLSATVAPFHRIPSNGDAKYLIIIMLQATKNNRGCTSKFLKFLRIPINGDTNYFLSFLCFEQLRTIEVPPSSSFGYPAMATRVTLNHSYSCTKTYLGSTIKFLRIPTNGHTNYF